MEQVYLSKSLSSRHKAVDRLKHAAYLAGMANELDATGLLCPLPVLKARKRLQNLSAGEILTLRADDPAAVVDVPHFCAEAGHDLLSAEDDSGVQIYVIRKGG